MAGEEEAVRDEVEALGAIYGTDFEDEVYPRPATIAGVPCVRRFTVRNIVLVSSARPAVTCTLTAHFSLPAAYPATAPPLLSLAAEPPVPAEQRAALAHAVVARCFHEGGVCCYDCVELLRSGGGEAGEAAAEAARALLEVLERRWDAKEEERAAQTEHEQARVAAPKVVEGEPLSDRKSKFIAFGAVVHSEAEVDAVMDLLWQNKKIAEATHRMLAYRIRTADGGVVEKRDDDGETGAGDKMLYLLQASGEVETMVVVVRWYGGIHLGNDRFRHIVDLSRNLIRSSDFAALRTVPPDTAATATTTSSNHHNHHH